MLYSPSVRRSIRRLGCLVWAAVAGACCTRYERFTYPCPVDLPSRSALTWQHTVDHPGEMDISVLKLSSLSPLQVAQVRVDSSGWAVLVSAGHARLSLPGPGRTARIQVRALGYAVAAGAVDIVPDSGIVAAAILEGRGYTIDEACGNGSVAAYRRRPWWKVW